MLKVAKRREDIIKVNVIVRENLIFLETITKKTYFKEFERNFLKFFDL